jgi:hypothetical protein
LTHNAQISQATYIPARTEPTLTDTWEGLPAPQKGKSPLTKDLNPVVQTRLPEDPLARLEKTIEGDDRRRRSTNRRQVVHHREREWKCSYTYSRNGWVGWGNRGKVAWVCVLREYRTAEVRHRAHGGSERVGKSCSHILVGMSTRMIEGGGGRMFAVRS